MMKEMMQMGSPNQYDIYYNWLDEYNVDYVQPPETPTALQLRMKFPELGNFEARQIIVSWAERAEKRLKGG